MTELEKYDRNKNGRIDKWEWAALELEDRKRRIDDEDAKRDAQRRMTWFALSGMVLYPLAILAASVVGFDQAASLIADIAAVYVVAVSGVTAAYFGFNAMTSKNASTTAPSFPEDDDYRRREE